MCASKRSPPTCFSERTRGIPVFTSNRYIRPCPLCLCASVAIIVQSASNENRAQFCGIGSGRTKSMKRFWQTASDDGGRGANEPTSAAKDSPGTGSSCDEAVEGPRGTEGRQHLHETVAQRAVSEAARASGTDKRVTCPAAALLPRICSSVATTSGSCRSCSGARRRFNDRDLHPRSAPWRPGNIQSARRTMSRITPKRPHRRSALRAGTELVPQSKQSSADLDQARADVSRDGPTSRLQQQPIQSLSIPERFGAAATRARQRVPPY
jgi:hypothetical protein